MFEVNVGKTGDVACSLNPQGSSSLSNKTQNVGIQVAIKGDGQTASYK